MTMIHCPKCGFEQPPDRYCASCGVDLETYKGKKLSTPLKASTFVFLGIALTLLLLIFLFSEKLKTWDLGKIYPDSRIVDNQTDAKFGVSSQNIRDENSSISDDSDSLPAPQARATVKEITESNRSKDLEFKPIPSRFSIGEITDVEINQLMLLKDHSAELNNVIWGTANEIPLIRKGLVDKELTLNLGENKFNYEDEFTKIDLFLEVVSASNKGLRGKIKYSRVMDGGLQVYAMDESVSGDVNIPYNKSIYIIDRLPRISEARNQIVNTNTLLSLFHKSRTFMDDTSDCILILQFENPYNQ